MSIILLNVGAAIPQTDDEAAKGLTRFWTAGQIEDAIYRNFAPLGYQLLRSNLVQSATEPTIVQSFQVGNDADLEAIHKAARALSDELEQDCVAIIALGHGALVGERAAKWGNFDSAFFQFPR